MKKQKPYAQLVSQAESAVASIKDPELRRVAFERVLDDLLSAESSPHGKGLPPPTPRVEKRTGQKTASKTGKSRGPKGHIRELVDDGFFKKPKTIAEVKAELANRGHHIALTSLSGPLQSLCQDKVLRRNKTKTKGKKETFSYSEW